MPTDVPTLEDAIAFAALAHRGQGYPTSDLRREPFILHPMRVMLAVATETERVVAIFHDLVEDTGYTVDDLRRRGYPEPVVAAVDRLTRREGEPYERYIRRLGGDALARRVKLADLADNLVHNRGVDSIAEERARVARYGAARSWLRSIEAGGTGGEGAGGPG